MLILEVGKLYQVESFSELLFYYEPEKYPSDTSVYNNPPFKPVVMYLGWDIETKIKSFGDPTYISPEKFLYLDKIVFFPTGYEFIKVH